MRPALALVLTVFGTTSSAAQPTVTKAKAEVAAQFGRIIAAIRGRDTATLARLYAPHYTFVLGGGDSVVVLTREERLQSIANNADSIATLTVERCDVDLEAAAAISRCWVRQGADAASTGRWTGILTTTVFERDTRGRWRALASHASVNRMRRP